MALPYSAFRDNHKCVAARIIAFILDQAIEVKLHCGYHAAARSHISRVQRGEASIAPEDAKDADALVRTERGALARDRFLGSADGSRKADAVFGSLNVIIHRLGNANNAHAFGIEPLCEAERVIAAYGDEAIEVEVLDILEHERREVVDLVGNAQRFELFRREILRQTRAAHLRRIGTRGMQDGTAGAI